MTPHLELGTTSYDSSSSKPKRLIYLSRVPRKLPDGYVLVHNHVTPVLPIGRSGFRIWLAEQSDRHEVCPCPAIPELPAHYKCSLRSRSASTCAHFVRTIADHSG
jgi:hypothetical protein